MLKVKLLNNGGYSGMGDKKFPVIIEDFALGIQGCDVIGSELIKSGIVVNLDAFDKDYLYHFYYGSECEVIGEE